MRTYEGMVRMNVFQNRVVECTVVMLALASTARASVVYDLNQVFSGDPVGPSAPWGRLTFTNAGANTVTLTIENLIPSSSEGSNFLRFVYFNVKEPIIPTSVTATHTGGSAPTVILRKSSNPGAGGSFSAYRPDGDGYFDFRIDFDGSANQLGEGNSSVLQLVRLGLTENDFADISEPGQGQNPSGFHAAAHLQGLDGGGSAWIADGGVVVPLPAAAWMGMSLLGGVGGVGFFRRRRLVEA
jgi:hypothetical protein